MDALETLLYEIFLSCQNIPGDFGEIGLWEGGVFKHVIIPAAITCGKMARGFDSFVGMNTPGKHDHQYVTKDIPRIYNKGHFSVGGLDHFTRHHMQDQHPDSYELYDGYIPGCFEKVPLDILFSCIRIDVDHYQPTLDSLGWVWKRLSPSGVILCDDYLLSNPDIHANKAIREWVSLHEDHITTEYKGYNTLMIMKI